MGCMVGCLAAAQAIDGDRTTVWSGELVLDKEYVVPAGYTLKIQPGTTIRMQKYWDAKITVKGTLVAAGTKEKPIRFLASKPGYWGGLTFGDAGADGKLEHCLVWNARRAAITANGASLTIRGCTFVNEHRDGFIYCSNGARAVIEGNTFKWDGKAGPTAVICEASPAVIGDNNFGNCRIGVQLLGFKAGGPRATIKGNDARPCVVAFFDEDVAPPGTWKKAWQSKKITRPVKLAVSRIGKADIVTICPNAGMGIPWGKNGPKEDPEGIDLYVLSQQNGKYAVKKVHDEKTKNVPQFKAKVTTGFAMADGVNVQVERFPSALSLLGRDGCMDTQAAYAVLLTGDEDGKQVVWRTPKFPRGALSFTAADLDGDDVMELIVTTGRRCEGKGQVFVYRQTAKCSVHGSAITDSVCGTRHVAGCRTHRRCGPGWLLGWARLRVCRLRGDGSQL